MNAADRIWDIPPPPGTEDIDLEVPGDPTKDKPREKSPEKPREEKSLKGASDRLAPSNKSAEVSDQEKRHTSERSRRRSKSRSRSRGRHHRRRHSRSRSRDRHRRSRSRSRRRRRRYSSSRSRSRSPGYRHGRYRHSRRKRSSSRRRSRSESRSKSSSKSHHKSHKRVEKDRQSRTPQNSSSDERLRQSRTPQYSSSDERVIPDADINEVDMKIEEEEEDPVKDNVFKNDGSFLEMFKKMQEQQQQKQEPPAAEEAKKPVLPTFGKRRGGKVLKTGMVQKVRQMNDEENNAQDAWSVYMKEVRKYKEACCDDDSKTRPLVK